MNNCYLILLFIRFEKNIVSLSSSIDFIYDTKNKYLNINVRRMHHACNTIFIMILLIPSSFHFIKMKDSSKEQPQYLPLFSNFIYF